jgi:indole-3-glycerol phosphate synthase
MNKLQEIIFQTKNEVEKCKTGTPVPSLITRNLYSREPLSFIGHLRNAADGFGIIAEFKRKSPSAGIIRDDIDPVDMALEYVKHGASCISVLTDENYFGGSLHDLERIRRAVRIPVLRKDFIIDEYQLDEAKAYGADAVLLIADILSRSELENLYGKAGEIGLECLVEIYDEAAIGKINFDSMRLIGINNRDLRTFTVDLDHTKRMIQKLPDDVFIISESGIQSREDIALVKGFGANGALIGESLMRDSTMLLEI